MKQACLIFHMEKEDPWWEVLSTSKIFFWKVDLSFMKKSNQVQMQCWYRDGRKQYCCLYWRNMERKCSSLQCCTEWARVSSDSVRGCSHHSPAWWLGYGNLSSKRRTSSTRCWHYEGLLIVDNLGAKTSGTSGTHLHSQCLRKMMAKPLLVPQSTRWVHLLLV